jgi:hypothetical protein
MLSNLQHHKVGVEKTKKLNLNQTVKMKKTVRVKKFVGKDEEMVIRVGLYICKHGTKLFFYR